MKTLKTARILAFLTFFATALAMAGGMEGGGGMGVQCGDTHLRTLDLYEAEEIHHLQIPNKYSDIDTNLAIYGTQIGAYTSDYPTNTNDRWVQQEVLKFVKQEVVARFKDIPAGAKLPSSKDATLPPIPSGCSIVQIATYADNGTIYRDRKLWDLLDVNNKSALILHEGIYRKAKLEGAETSDGTRYIVGLAFAEKLPDSIFRPIWNSLPKVWCGTQGPTIENFEFFAIEEKRSGRIGVGIYFSKFRNKEPMERLSAFVPNMELFDFFNPKHPMVRTTILGSLFENSWNLEFEGDFQDGYGIQIRVDTKSPLEPYSTGQCEIRL